MDRIGQDKSIFFISDTHFGHFNIIKYCNRPFIESKDMNSAILDSINSVVKKKDILYVLGDFCHKGGDPSLYRKDIICEDVHLIIGNHDNLKKFGNDFTSIEYQKMIMYQNQKIFMAHYPMRSWPESYRKSWALYGHVHGRLNKEDTSSDRLTLDVGVDNKREGIAFGTPWSFKDIQKVFSTRAKIFQEQTVDKTIKGVRMS